MIKAAVPETVVLLHGLLGHRFVMLRLAKTLRRHGYHTRNFGYRSIPYSIDRHACRLKAVLEDLTRDRPGAPLHLVTHSMGSIVARRTLALAPATHIRRCVMLGPPNRGSHVARRLAPSLGGICPPLRELSDAANSYVNQLDGSLQLDLGIIAAASDHVVSLRSTMLPCQHDHIVLPGRHGELPWRRDTCEQVLHFLQHGNFAHPDHELQSSPERLGTFSV